ncbi:MAG: methyltransferase domain-containing protein [Candidatus Dormiibacterota bacterium]
MGRRVRAIGPEMTAGILALARQNARDAGVAGAEFGDGCLQSIPLPDASGDVAISDGVINLTADKPLVRREAARVLRPGGRLVISDVIADEDVDAATRADMSQWPGRIAGAFTDRECREALAQAGLTEVVITPTHRLHTRAVSALVQACRSDGISA